MREFKMNEIEHRKSSSFLQVYSNVATTGESFWDVTLTFGAINTTGGDDSSRPVIDDMVSVTMSWEHAKALSEVLVKRVQKYEEAHGKLRTQPKP